MTKISFDVDFTQDPEKILQEIQEKARKEVAKREFKEKSTAFLSQLHELVNKELGTSYKNTNELIKALTPYTSSGLRGKLSQTSASGRRQTISMNQGIYDEIKEMLSKPKPNKAAIARETGVSVVQVRKVASGGYDAKYGQIADSSSTPSDPPNPSEPDDAVLEETEPSVMPSLPTAEEDPKDSPLSPPPPPATLDLPPPMIDETDKLLEDKQSEAESLLPPPSLDDSADDSSAESLPDPVGPELPPAIEEETGTLPLPPPPSLGEPVENLPPAPPPAPAELNLPPTAIPESTDLETESPTLPPPPSFGDPVEDLPPAPPPVPADLDLPPARTDESIEEDTEESPLPPPPSFGDPVEDLPPIPPASSPESGEEEEAKLPPPPPFAPVDQTPPPAPPAPEDHGEPEDPSDSPPAPPTPPSSLPAGITRPPVGPGKPTLKTGKLGKPNKPTLSLKKGKSKNSGLKLTRPPLRKKPPTE